MADHDHYELVEKRDYEVDQRIDDRRFNSLEAENRDLRTRVANLEDEVRGLRNTIERLSQTMAIQTGAGEHGETRFV